MAWERSSVSREAWPGRPSILHAPRATTAQAPTPALTSNCNFERITIKHEHDLPELRPGLAAAPGAARGGVPIDLSDVIR